MFPRDFRLPSRHRLDLRSSGMLGTVQWQFGTKFRNNLSVPSSGAKKSNYTARPLKMVPIVFTETSVRNYHSTVRNIPQELTSQNTCCYFTV